MSEHVFRFYYIQRGNTVWEHEDYFERRARQEAFVDAHDNIIAYAFREGDESELPETPEPERTEA